MWDRNRDIIKVLRIGGHSATSSALDLIDNSPVEGRQGFLRRRVLVFQSIEQDSILSPERKQTI